MRFDLLPAAPSRPTDGAYPRSATRSEKNYRRGQCPAFTPRSDTHRLVRTEALHKT